MLTIAQLRSCSAKRTRRPGYATFSTDLRMRKPMTASKPVVLDLGALGGSGLSKLKRIGDAIDDFEESGKPVIATADFYTQGNYYLASRDRSVPAQGRVHFLAGIWRLSKLLQSGDR